MQSTTSPLAIPLEKAYPPCGSWVNAVRLKWRKLAIAERKLKTQTSRKHLKSKTNKS